MEEFGDFPIQSLNRISKVNSMKYQTQYKDIYKKKYLQKRKSLLQLLRNLSESKALYNNEEIFYLSLIYLDRILCSNYICYLNNNLTTIAICCFSLAIKFLGNFDAKIFRGDIFKVKSFKQLEFKCISYLQYHLSVTTVFDYLKILTMGNMQHFSLARKILLLSVNQDFFLNYDHYTFALGIFNFAKEKLQLSYNARQSKAFNFHKDKESLSLQIVEIVSFLKSLEKNKRNTLSASCSYSSFEDMKKVTELQLRDDCSDSTTYSTNSQQSNDNYNTGRAKEDKKNPNQVLSMRQKFRNNMDYNITNSMSISNSTSLSCRVPFKPNIQPMKTIETMKSVFNQTKTRNLAIDLTQMSKINFMKLNSLGSRFLPNQNSK